MLHIKPVIDENASDGVVAIYGRIRDGFKLDAIPLFFQYMGNFPDFLEYIWKSIETNLKSAAFWDLSDECKDKCLDLYSSVYSPSAIANELLESIFKNETSAHFIGAKLKNLSITNASIALLFVSMREAIKGWAITTKLLKDKYDHAYFEAVTPKIEREIETSLVDASSSVQESSKLEQFDYIKFMAIVQSEVDDSIKHESHLHARLALEEHLVDHKDKVEIDVTYRTLAQYASDYKHFDELVYLLSESFPTIAANRVIVSSIGSILLKGITSQEVVREGS
ncbi:hypothetical protein A2690_05160 [Candidatus Roizmanbacteria bacterium RIFCSPHIGHO2_01_FULL_39_12b]|uniref:Uncharacterized protein n=1 Tax=Candidatus Roizmanbacteria bacterium RIFCSPHIGHO2_01_FULL_39_12b TaxID=1802030 RepID=A0A1F7G9I8_9BACT|nr:MAG: hypothetical protein A2690_05160 [Candidatus Roizmanbacteria bacterium RIFCSPHIGHO2_01_FULL_39_12b]OGK45902.1 MAG: hypothetical protein A3B46_03340 [Candidatus Roizmanbacteria bacterium RIFCSPLOWO2_01_FULL_39_19]